VQRSKFNVQDPEPSRSFALFRHTAIRREQKFSQLAVPLDHMIVSVGNRKRSFHDWFSTLPFFYYQPVAPVNTGARRLR
jgi:hypothetical protein